MALPFRLHAEAVEELLDQLPPLVLSPEFGPAELRVAVADDGMGFGGSLRRRGEAHAVLEALTSGASRVPGRGAGLREGGRTVAGWGGWMRVRSRTVVVEGTPPWRDVRVRDQRPFLPGVQLEVVLSSPPGGVRITGLGTAPPIA